jgi:hypothetical protein
MWVWGPTVPPAVFANTRDSLAARPLNNYELIGPPISNTRPWIHDSGGMDSRNYVFPWGSRINVDLHEPAPTGDFLPLRPTLGANNDPLVAVADRGHSIGWKGQVRPSINGQVDLVTGKPVVNVTDLTLPFAGTEFRLTRSRSSTPRSSYAGHSGQAATMSSDSWWDWGGQGWMLGENPLFLHDVSSPYLMTADTPTTSWVVLDAHRSIPFQQIEGSLDENGQQRYEGLPRLGAELKVFGGKMAKWYGNHPEGPRWVPDNFTTPPASTTHTPDVQWKWRRDPTMARVTLYNGALTYWFVILPKQWVRSSHLATSAGDPVLSGEAGADIVRADAVGLIPPWKWDPQYLDPGWNAGNGVYGTRRQQGATSPGNVQPGVAAFKEWTEGWAFTDGSVRPLDPMQLRARTSGPEGLRQPAHWWTHRIWSGHTLNYTLGSPLRSGHVGVGMGRLGLLTKMEDRHGHEVHIEYVDVPTRAIDNASTEDEIEVAIEGPAIGQIKAVHLVGPRRVGDPDLSSPKKI